MDYLVLKFAAMKAGKTNRQLAKDLGVSEQAFYNKLDGRAEFKASEIKRLADVLNLDMDDVNHIFFDGIVN